MQMLFVAVPLPAVPGHGALFSEAGDSHARASPVLKVECSLMQMQSKECELIPSRFVNAADRQASLPVFDVLQRVGFVTIVGCVCAVPMRSERGALGLLVCTARLQLAARAVNCSLHKRNVTAFMRAGIKVGGTGILLQPHVVREQWRCMGPQAREPSQDTRSHFARRFRRLITSSQNKKKIDDGPGALEVLAFGRPLSAQGVDDALLRDLLNCLGLK